MDRGASLARTAVTGLVLCGGRGQRMGGQDKGWLLLSAPRVGPARPASQAGSSTAAEPHPLEHAQPLVVQALARLAPQVGTLAISANRHLARYAALGHPVWPDDPASRYAGPLAGMAAALARMATPWLAVAPCDMPSLPTDWVARLGCAALAADAPLATATLRTPEGLRPMPVVAVLNRRVLAALHAELQAGERRVGEVLSRLGAVSVVFDDASAFVNANTPQELAELAERGAAAG